MDEIIDAWGPFPAARAQQAIEELLDEIEEKAHGYGRAEPLERIADRYVTLALAFERSRRRLLVVYDDEARVLDVLGPGDARHARGAAFHRACRRLRLTNPARDPF